MYEILIINKETGYRYFIHTRSLGRVELAENEFIDFIEFIDD